MNIVTKQNLLEDLHAFKEKYKNDGFNILALFGSYADDNQNLASDIDILYDVNDTFLEKYRGFRAVSKTLEIQEELATFFHKQIDFTSLSGLSKSIKEEIIQKAIYV